MHAEQPARQQNRHPVGDALDLAEDVGCDEDGALSRQRPDVAPHLDDLARVEPVGGLIEDQQGGIAQESLGDGDALAIPARELADEHAPDVAEAEALDGGLDRSRRRPAGEPLEPGHEGEKFADAHPAIERDVLGDVTHSGPRRQRVVHDVEPGNAGGSGRREQVAGENAKNRGLPGAVRAEQPHDLAGLDLQGDMVDGQSGPVPLGELIGDDDRSHAERNATAPPG